jgi:potassium efflux system protein
VGGLAVSAAPPQVAQPKSVNSTAPALDIPASEHVLAQLQNQMRAASDDKSLAAIGAQAGQIQDQAQALVAARTAALAKLNQSLSHASSRGRSSAAAAERSLIASQEGERVQAQAILRQAQALQTAASATFTEVAERRRESFSARVLERSTSPLEPEFWTGLSAAVGPDLGRLNALAGQEIETAKEAPEPTAALILLIGVLFAIGLPVPVRKGLETLVHRALLRGGGHGRFGRTAHALLLTIIDTGVPVLAAVGLRLAASWGGLLSQSANALSGTAVAAVGWAAAILALGRGLATDPEHRLLTVPAAVARRTAGLLIVVAVITAAGFLLSRLTFVVGASVAATIAANCLTSLAYAAVAAAILVSAGPQTTPDAPETPADSTAGSPTWTLISLGLGVAVIMTCAAVLTGFTTLAVLVSGQIFWLSVLSALTFLILRFIDDMCAALFAPEGWVGRQLASLFRLRLSTIAQISVLTSAGLQLIVLLGAVTMALTPFGNSGQLLATHIHQLGTAIRIGSATVSPIAIVTGLVVLGIGLALAHLVRGWVESRYLPATEWDAGIRNSVSTGVSYIGVGVALLCAFSAMGLGFKQIALVASALSVGIGFGLQQVVQNFVSGLILLVERPVKVGDWVNVDGVEGDIRRIRVRATEIQTFDRTTVIVPNSDLITKQVQNKTLGDPRGRIQLDISIANPADMTRASALILNIADGIAEILKDPKPAVYIDSLAGGGGNFKVYLFVETPRAATRARSNVYSAVLSAFLEAGISLLGVGAPQNVIIEPGPMLQSALESIARGTPPETSSDGGQEGTKLKGEGP